MPMSLPLSPTGQREGERDGEGVRWGWAGTATIFGGLGKVEVFPLCATAAPLLLI